ncbi:MAG: translation initiation factor [Cyanobacteria bacterium P01_F01_bin.42]
MGSKRKKERKADRQVYTEFGAAPQAEVTERPDLPPSEQILTIQATRKGRKGKTVTIIRGFQLSSSSLQALAKTLKTHCGSGGAVRDDAIEIQGDHRPKLKDYLTGLGYRAKISGG